MIIYLVKSTLLLGLLFGVYKLLLENEKMHRFNRFFLLFALIFGLTAPLISFEVSSETSIAGVKMQQMERVVNAPAEAVNKSVEPLIMPKQTQEASPKADITPVVTEEPGWQISTLDVLFGIYGSITLFLLIRFVVGLIEIRNKVKVGSHQETDHATLVLLDEPITPQSFLGYIFLEKKQFQSGKIEPEILDHEITHIRQLHSLDVLFIEFLKVIFWFNPLMYFFKYAIQLNHEFLADESVVSNGSSVSDYQKTLIRVSAGNKPMNTTSSINYSLTKKRFKMMSKKFSGLRSGTKGLILAPILLATTLMFCTNQSDYPMKITRDSDVAYFNTHLYADYEKSRELMGERDGPGIRFDANGNPFTGIMEIRYTKNDSLISETKFKNGIMKSSVRYDKEGNALDKYEYGYIGNQFKMIRHIDSTGMLVEEWSDAKPDQMGYHKQWHPNGQLKYEAYFTGNIRPEGLEIFNMQYQGLMTLYDEEGNIIQQDEYVDGELIEKIR